MLDSNVDSHGIIEGCRKAEAEAISGARWLALRGPADHHESLAVEAFDLEPQAAIAGRVRDIGAFRDDAFERHCAGLLMESRAGPGRGDNRCNAGAARHPTAARRAAPCARSA